MSHIECRHCKTRNHIASYGCGGPFGGLSGYTICTDCGRTLECTMDLDGTPEDEEFQAKVDAAIDAQFQPGAGPIKRAQTAFATECGTVHLSLGAHIPGQD